tara:strand:- start:1020 stop:1676 length:657 start_codon:yes stop_codon:yes gene_type:complete
MSFLLYQNENVIGVFDNHNKAKEMAQAIMNFGWASDFSVTEYKLNSIFKVSTVEIENPNNVKEETEEENDESNSEEKRSLQTKLNVLKQQKDKIEESKAKFEVDLKLYNEFKKKLETETNFTIPELFVDKYKIFHQLDVEDNVSWESFSMLYKEPDFYGKYSNVFEVTNSFDTKFLKNIDSETEDSDSDSSEESDIDSEGIIEVIQVVNSSEENSSED